MFTHIENRGALRQCQEVFVNAAGMRLTQPPAAAALRRNPLQGGGYNNRMRRSRGLELGAQMEAKTPTMLVILVETARLRWFVAAVGLDDVTTPLLCSEVDDLRQYRNLAFDEQVAFLRHRFCGVLQRGCDRLWLRNAKACQFVFVFEQLLPEHTGKLTQTLAAHFAEWLLKPPVAVFTGTSADDLERLSGTIDQPLENLLRANLTTLCRAKDDVSAWQPARKNGLWCALPES
jgi:hypothetical protein